VTKASASPETTRWLTIALGGAIVCLAIFLVLKGGGDGSGKALTDAGPDAGDANATADAGANANEDDAGDPFGVEAIGSAPSEREDRLEGGVGSQLADGQPVPPLSDKAPRTVRFGVVLVTYAGAQGAPGNARSKNDARELADKLAAEAKTDFHAAVSHGDTGSSDDLGRIPRGTLELAPEYVLFNLASGQTSEPIDTPRGFWIVKRTD